MGNLPEISLGTAALIIFGLCAGYMFLRGLVRTLLNTACLLLSAWVGFRIWQVAPSLAIDWFGKSPELISTGLPVVAFLATFFVLRRLMKLFRSPLAGSENSEPRSSGNVLFRLLVTVIPAALLCLTAATFLHHASAVAEVRNSAEPGTRQTPSTSLAERLNQSLALAIPVKLMDWLDPLTTEPRLKLAKMIAANPDKSVDPIIDPETGRPYPRAIVVDDPELVSLAREGRFSTLLRHPLLSEALKDPLARQALGLD